MGKNRFYGKKEEYRAYCPYCGDEGFSHKSQDDAERVVRNHEQRCEQNPDNDPDAVR
jgi:hypothetical protein